MKKTSPSVSPDRTVTHHGNGASRRYNSVNSQGSSPSPNRTAGYNGGMHTKVGGGYYGQKEKKKRVQSAVTAKRVKRHQQEMEQLQQITKQHNANQGGPTSMMMESLATYVPHPQGPKTMKRSDLDRIRNRMCMFVHSMPGEKKMDHK